MVTKTDNIVKSDQQPASRTTARTTTKRKTTTKSSQSEQLSPTTETVVVTVDLLNVRKRPTMTAGIIKTVKKGDELTLVSHIQGFGELKDNGGFVYLDYVVPLNTEVPAVNE